MPASKIDSINKQIFGGQKEYDMIDVYHALMVSYGYIPWNDYVKMDADRVNELMIRINKMNENGNSTGRRGGR